MPSLGFGLERLGLLAMRAPLVSLLLVVALTAVGVHGLPRLEADDAISELFRSDSPEYRDYASMSERFPTSEYDVLVVVEGDELLSPEALEKVRFLHLELEFADAAAGVLSIFSMRDPPGESGFPPPMIPDPIPQGAAFDTLMERVAAHPLLNGRFLSRDETGDLTVLVVSINRDVIAENGLSPSIRQIRDIGDEVLAGTGLRATYSGAPVMQMEIRDAIRHDRIAYNLAGLAVGIAICFVLFRRLSLVLIAAICPVLAVVWTLGLLGLSGQTLNTFINVIPPLIMVIAFSDAMHLLFSIRRSLREGKDRYEATRTAVMTIGPACVLTSLTTSIALLSLTIADSGLVRQFGFAGAFATLLAYVAVMTVIPMASVLLIRDEEKFRAGEESRARAVIWLQQVCGGLGAWHVRFASPVAVIGLVVLAVFTSLHLQLKPHYSLGEQVPRQNESIETAEQLDEKLTGAHPLHIMIHWPEEMSFGSARVLAAMTDAHMLHENHAEVGNVWSIETLKRWLEDIGVEDSETLVRYVGMLPEHLTQRFLNSDVRAALVTGRLANLDAAEAVSIMHDLDRQLEALRSAYPEFTFTVTGLSALSALRSADMIRELNYGLMLAVVIVITLIGFAFRSFKILLLSIVPNLFPIVAAGTLLYLTDSGLAYASVIALTVAFGMSVDDTIHFLSRLKLEHQISASMRESCHATLEHIGPVLILTTIVLIAGLAVTMVSDLPSMRLFGSLTMTTLVAALVADLLILPAIVISSASVKSEVGESLR